MGSSQTRRPCGSGVSTRRRTSAARWRLGSARRGEQDEKSEEVRRRFEALADPDRDVIAHAGRAVLVLGALGRRVWRHRHESAVHRAGHLQLVSGDAHVTAANVFGVVSLIFWALMIVVSIKYAGFIMRAHNRGDGGIMALTALLQRSKVAKGPCS